MNESKLLREKYKIMFFFSFIGNMKNSASRIATFCSWGPHLRRQWVNTRATVSKAVLFLENKNVKVHWTMLEYCTSVFSLLLKFLYNGFWKTPKMHGACSNARKSMLIPLNYCHCPIPSQISQRLRTCFKKPWDISAQLYEDLTHADVKAWDTSENTILLKDFE